MEKAGTGFQLVTSDFWVALKLTLLSRPNLVRVLGRGMHWHAARLTLRGALRCLMLVCFPPLNPTIVHYRG